MSIHDIHKLTFDIENSDPRNAEQQEALHGRLRDFQTMLERAQARELAGYMDTAALLTDYLRAMGGIGPEEVQTIVLRLVKQVDLAFKPADTAFAPLLEKRAETTPAPPSLSLGTVDPSQADVEDSRIGGKFLGEILLQLGYIRVEDIDDALRVQRAAGIRMGEALVQIGATSYDRVKTAIDVQKKLVAGNGLPRVGGGGPPRPVSL